MQHEFEYKFEVLQSVTTCYFTVPFPLVRHWLT